MGRGADEDDDEDEEEDEDTTERCTIGGRMKRRPLLRARKSMKTKQLLRVAYVVVTLAVLAWLGIGAAIWSAWRHHQEEVSASAASAATTIAPPIPVPGETFDRARSSVQYVTSDAESTEGELPEVLSRDVDLPGNERSLGGWIMFLRSEGVPVCWQVAPRKRGEADDTFAMPLERASVRDVLDEMCRLDRRYHWECMKDSAIVNILADEQLDASLGDVSFRPKRFVYCLPDLQSRVSIYGTFGVDVPQNYQNLFYWPVSVVGKQITVRDYLNLAVAQYEGMTWTVNAQGLLELDAPQATRDAVVEKYRDEAPDGPVR